MKDEATNPVDFDAEFARVFDERIAAQTAAQTDEFERASLTERMRLSQQNGYLTEQYKALAQANAKFAAEVRRLESVVRDRERMLCFVIATWLVLLAMVLLNR